MFLKSLDIFGFKSFADKTHIDFSDGITALLGPNGCGKSNVVDAIKWVLAENKSKNLRADKMEDVIFNGTEKRAPLNVAEVTLTIMNENGLLPLEESEVAIKRRLFRSGENEYFINGRQAGPREIRSLFMDTGVGKAAYSVMEQGKIDQILSSKPEDRRYLFEEAAGISRSKAECMEAERELERTRINMQQIQVSLSEIKRQYDALKTQAEKTKQYRSLKDAIFSDELDLTLLRLKKFTEDKTHLENDLKDAEKKRNTVRLEIDELANTLSENMSSAKAMQEELYAKQAELIGIEKEKNGKEDIIKQFSFRASEINEKIAELQAHKKTIEETIASLENEIAQKNKELSEKQNRLADLQKNIHDVDEKIKTFFKKIAENENTISQLENEIATLKTERINLQSELAKITEDIVASLDARLKESGFSDTAMKNAKDSLSSIAAKLKIFVAGRKNIFSDFISSGKKSLDENASYVLQARDAFLEIENLFSEIENAFQKYEKSSPALIADFFSSEGVMSKKRAIDEKINTNHNRSNTISETMQSLNNENKTLLQKIENEKETLNKFKINGAHMHEQIDSHKEQCAILNRSKQTSEHTLSSNANEIVREEKRKADLDAQTQEAKKTLAEIDERAKKTSAEAKKLNNEITSTNSRVAGKQSALQKKQDEQNRLQSLYEKISLSLISTDTEIKNVKQNFQEQHSRDLMEFEERMYKITKPSQSIRETLANARASLKSLGQVNLMAVEEFAEVKERFERQQTNFDDTKKSLENLQRVSEEIRSKSSELFLDTYNKIKKNFHNMFRRLFNGGRAELRLIEPDNILTSGIDIYAQPPGKKLENIALLSGGEKTMTAVALLFATYQVRPSPFCLLDEIDAALDDKNVSSFVTTLRSFANVSQYIVITHNKKTVMGATTMLGITMEESGVSKILALKLGEEIQSALPIDDANENFVEEEVENEDAVIPPRPAKRIHNPDGTITDPDYEKAVKREKALAKEAIMKAKSEGEKK